MGSRDNVNIFIVNIRKHVKTRHGNVIDYCVEKTVELMGRKSNKDIQDCIFLVITHHQCLHVGVFNTFHYLNPISTSMDYSSKAGGGD